MKNNIEVKPSQKIKSFIIIFLSFNSIAFAIQTLLPSYLNYASSEALSAKVNDEHCIPRLQGIGMHCFGDYYYSLQFVKLTNPWSEGHFPYPPLSVFVFKPFMYLQSYFPNNHLSLNMYLVFLITCSLFPTIFTYVCDRDNFKSLLILALTFSSAPIIMSFDRGNNQLMLVPLYFIFQIGYLKNGTYSLFVAGLLLVLLKPQMILLGMIFLANREFKRLILWLCSSIILFFLSFFLINRNIVSNVKSYLLQLTGYQNYTNAGSLNPTNFSFANSWSLIKRIVSTIFPNVSTLDPTGKWSFYSPFVSILIIFSVSIVLLISGKHNPKYINLIIVFSIPIFIPNVSFSYYLVSLSILFIIFISKSIILLKQNLIGEVLESPSTQDILEILSLNRLIRYFLSTSLILIIIPWTIPWKVFPYFQDVFWSGIGINWFFAQLILTITFILSLFSSSKNQLHRHIKHYVDRIKSWK